MYSLKVRNYGLYLPQHKRDCKWFQFVAENFFLPSVTRQNERFLLTLKLSIPQLISNVSAPYLHQRPPSVGMPRHALRRRIPTYTWSAVAARCRDFHSIRNSARVGRAPGALLCFGFSYSKFTPQLSRISKTSHTIWLKFGTRTPLGTVKMISY